MKPTTELCRSETGLIYRLRRGQPHGALSVLLHGLSGDENAMWIFDHALPREATVIAPRAPYPSEFGGTSWARSVVRDDLDDVDFQEAIDQLARFVAEVIARYQIDPLRVILMGFSQGAALSYAFSLTRPEALCGVIALAGFLSHPAQRTADSRIQRERNAVKSKDALPHYLIIHGTHDEAVPIDRARAARSVLESRGAIVEYHEHRVGHKVSAQGMKEIARWIREVLA
jgi:phospholipase/carboxylesterase